ncbi:lyase family protein [Tateyamaria sp. ANG-S1]|uniref:lyase family protein n=1 Tax=Tateyamaria sp. ANG-S1 TaxID=1577905 RepID=UPI00057E8B44|nr:lyase family protein [Tateyamaria sp. ANG-S1]KIC50917.1 3-carboxy-cis,cis-muconate cycloisomerase [Tateyamaria sp. ANG-S1]
MAASVFSSALYAKLFPTGDVGRLWTDSAEVRAMLLVEGALAKVQGAQGVIPEISAAFIHRSSLEVQIDPGGLADATGQNGVSVPALVSEFRKAMEAPEHAQYAHWGATSQDIIDTALMLRLRQTLAAQEAMLRSLLQHLGTQADAHADTPMVARTYGQHATPTSWGAVLAQWGQPLADALDDLETVKTAALWVSLSGAAGTASALGPHASETRAKLADALKLGDPGRSWHTDRGPILRVADWMARIVATLAGLGQTAVALTATDSAELVLSGAGSSSTMPQKQNPVGPSALAALGLQMTGLTASLHASASHQHQRDGAAWFTEWMVLPQIALSCAAALQITENLVAQWRPDTDAMAAKFDGLGSVHAEALSFALAANMPRPDAQTATKTLIADATAQGTSLEAVARAAHPDLPADLFDPKAQMGAAPDQARRFAARVSSL